MAASIVPNSGLTTFDSAVLMQTSIPDEIRDAAQLATVVPSALVLTTAAHSLVADNWESVPQFLSTSVPDTNPDYFYTAGHPDLIHGFHLDKRWGTSLASEKTNLIVEKKSISGDNMRLGQEENSLQDDGASNLVYEVMTRWWW